MSDNRRMRAVGTYYHSKDRIYVTPAGVAKRAKGVALGFIKGEKDVTTPLLTAVGKVLKIMTGKGQVKKGRK